ncbi:SIR2 family protein [Brochothrix thermosphacta]|uniref:SIR2 family protein n=1 Tax=Brochothrix thermosphacta TaxID=2756 RepID=UPI0009BFF2A8
MDNSLGSIKGLSGKKAANIYCYDDKDVRDKIIFNDGENDPLILRLHGELKNTNSLIFSQTQYTELMRQDYFVFEQLIPAVLLTSAVIIVGYSLNDPDIQLVLENTAKNKGIRSNIYLISTDNQVFEHRKKIFSNRYGIEIIDIYTEQGHTMSLKFALEELVQLKKILSEKNRSEKRDLFKLMNGKFYQEISRELNYLGQ